MRAIKFQTSDGRVYKLWLRASYQDSIRTEAQLRAAVDRAIDQYESHETSLMRQYGAGIRALWHGGSELDVMTRILGILTKKERVS